MTTSTRNLRLVTLLLLGLVACSKKSEDVLPGDTHDARMEGTWRLASLTVTAKEKGQAAKTATEYPSSPVSYEYRADGTWGNGTASGRYTSEADKLYLSNDGQKGVTALDIQTLTATEFRYGANTLETFLAFSRSTGANEPTAEVLAKIESLTFTIALTKTSNTTTPGKR
ncbi:MAG: hypothetical protein H7Y12_06775 [Sphingobacteriaceae bacterium]|nr:hypothetical protein [Cytophagaceae bacterium]